MKLLAWYGVSAGVRVGRHYAKDTRNKFKDFFGSRRDVEEGVWELSNGNIYIGRKAKQNLSERVLSLICEHSRRNGRKVKF